MTARDFATPPERDYIADDEERARTEGTRALRIARASANPDAIAEDPEALQAWRDERAMQRCPQPAVAAMTAPDPDPEDASPAPLPEFRQPPPLVVTHPPAYPPKPPRKPRPPKVPPTPPMPPLRSLDHAMTDLVETFGLGDVIDAAWAAGRRQHPRPSQVA